MNKLKEILSEVGFSDELIDAINMTPKMESQEINVDDICYQAFENNIISSTEINLSGESDTYN